MVEWAKTLVREEVCLALAVEVVTTIELYLTQLTVLASFLHAKVVRLERFFPMPHKCTVGHPIDTSA
jgi:hypothetical protein